MEKLIKNKRQRQQRSKKKLLHPINNNNNKQRRKTPHQRIRNKMKTVHQAVVMKRVVMAVAFPKKILNKSRSLFQNKKLRLRS